MLNQDFHKNVFINCPLDDEYKGILNAILFCLIRLEFNPRIATERQDSGESRLDKICELIRSSKYSIHDLSRCSPSYPDEFSRMNMPFELGLDFGCRNFGGSPFDQKRILVLEEQHRYHQFISDLSGSDIAAHKNEYDVAIRKVRNWIRSLDNSRPVIAASKVSGEYDDFKLDHYITLRAEGFSRSDIEDLPTNELINAIIQWLKPEQNP